MTRDVAICVAASTMAPSASSTSHHVWYWNRYMSTKPAARSCTNVRTDDTTMRLVCPSSSFHDTSPATSMRALAAQQLHVADVHHAAVHARRPPSAGEASAGRRRAKRGGKPPEGRVVGRVEALGAGRAAGMGRVVDIRKRAAAQGERAGGEPVGGPVPDAQARHAGADQGLGQPPDRAGGLVVERGVHLVEQQHRGARGERAQKGDTRLLAAGELRHVAIEPHVVQLGVAQQLAQGVVGRGRLAGAGP